MKQDLLKTIKIAVMVLLAFAVISAGFLAATKLVTKEKIALNEKLTLLKNFNQVLPPDYYDNDPVNDIKPLKPNALFSAKNPVANLARKEAKIVTVFLRPMARDGYSGNIHLLLAVRRDKTLAGVRVLRHKETPGLGDSIEVRKSPWVLDFNNKSLDNPQEKNWKVKKDGGSFDQFTGATITPRAIVKTIKSTLLYVEQNYQELFYD